MKKPIAVGGSAANPVTIGHYHLVKWLLESGKFSKVIWMVSGNRPDKKNLIDPEHRVNLTKLSFPEEWSNRKDTAFILSLDDAYGENTPTIDWLERLQEKHPEETFVWYTGVDSVAPKPEHGGVSEIESKWDRGDELVRDWNFIVFPRSGHVHPRDLSLPENFEVADVNLPETSSTEIRRRIAGGEPFEELMMPEAVEYLKKHSLYGFPGKTEETL